MPERGLPRRLDRPWVAASIGFVIGLSLVLFHLQNHNWDFSVFVVAGDHFVSSEEAPSSLDVLEGSYGFDGQFYFRFALDPVTAKEKDFGIRIDDPPLRHQRILYPLLAWIFARGDSSRTEWILVAINVLGIGALGLLGAMMARTEHRHALWGLAFCLYPGFILVLARDLTDVVSGVAVLGGLVALRKKEITAAGIALTAAAFSREGSLVVLGSIMATAFFSRSGASPISSRITVLRVSLVPVIAWSAWQAILWHNWGALGIGQSGGANLGFPLQGVANAFAGSFPVRSSLDILNVVELAMLWVLFISSALSLRRSRAENHEKLAFIVWLVVAALLNQPWIEDWTYLRATSDLTILSVAILLGRRDRLGFPPLLGMTSISLWLGWIHFVRS